MSYAENEFAVIANRLGYNLNGRIYTNKETKSIIFIETISRERPQLPQRRMPIDHAFLGLQSQCKCFMFGFLPDFNFVVSLEGVSVNDYLFNSLPRVDVVSQIFEVQKFNTNSTENFFQYDSPYDGIQKISFVRYKDNKGTLYLDELKKYIDSFDSRNIELSASSLEVPNKKSNHPLQQIFYGAPGTGKSHAVKKLTGELDAAGNEYEKNNVFRTTFHPDTDYATFVGCYKPTMQPTSKEEKTLTGKDEEITYEFVPQAFTDAYIYAYNHPEEPTYLVIEEINRGNCAQIFGDLFQLLDRKADGTSEYTIKADKDLAKYLTKELGADSEGIKDGKLRLPANLNILATMNTSDQSLFPMDSAFKRRWDWEYVGISYTEPKSSAFQINVGDGYSWVDFIKQVNKRIFDLTQSEDKELGNFFIKDSIDAEQFKSKVMFYLWYEVLRDEVEHSKYFFKYTTQDANGNEKNEKFTFKNLYGDNAEAILEGFLKYIAKGAE